MRFSPQPLDAITLKHLAGELKTMLDGAKVNKIQQVNHHEIIIHFWQSRPVSAQHKFIISIRPQLSFCGVIPDKALFERDYPKTPLNFCVLLRKYLIGAKVNSCTVLPDERVLIIGLNNYNETGDIADYELIIELMGKHSNIVLRESTLNLILGSAHGVSDEMSRFRTLRVGDPYAPPPKQLNKTPLSHAVSQEINALLLTKPKTEWVDLLLNTYSGWGRKTIEEIIEHATSSEEVTNKILQIQTKISPSYIDASHVLKGYKLISQNQTESINTVLSVYYLAALSQFQYLDLQQPLLRELENTKLQFIKRIQHLADAADVDYDALKQTADNTLTEGAIEHDWQQIQAAQKNYQQYKKAKSRHTQSQAEIEKLQDALDELETFILACEMTSNTQELLAYRHQASEFGFLKKSKARAETAKNKKPIKVTKAKKENQKIQKSKPLCITLDETARIWIGRTGPENAYLVRHLSQEQDWWFHVPHQPGAHVLLQCDAQNADFSKFNDLAAQCAIYFSRARYEGTSAVISTQGKNVKSIPGSLAGHVRFKHETQRFVKLNEDEVEQLI